MIGWLGVTKRARGKGIGRRLIAKVEDELSRFGYKDLRVETVGECTPRYEPYEETLKFYKSLGFTVVKRGRLRTDMGYKWRHSTLRKELSEV
jgi:GNAT superfamily N-acetyltransferase